MGACSVLSASVVPCIATLITREPFEGRVASGSAITIGRDRVRVEAEEPHLLRARFGPPPAGNDRRAWGGDSTAPHAGKGRVAPRDPSGRSPHLRFRSRPASATGCDADRSRNPPHYPISFIF